GYNKEYEMRLIALHRQIAGDAKLQTQFRALVGADKFNTLMDWQTVLNFRESVFKTQDFLDSAFDDNSLFRTYVWLGRIARDLPDWMGDWKTKLQYLTPQFYVSGILTQIDEKFLGLASFAKDSPRGLFLRFKNGGWVPLLGKAVYQRASDYKVAFKVASLLDDLVDEGVTVNGVLIDANAKRDLLLMKPVGGISLGALKESANPTLSNSKFLKDLLTDTATNKEYDKYLDFFNKVFSKLEAEGLVPKGDVPWLLDRMKGKTMGDKYLYMGPLVALGRFLDHVQNLFVDKTIGKLGIFKRYADWFKAGNPAFAKAWQASKVGTALRSLSNKFIDIGGGKITTGFLARVFGSRTLAPVAKALGSLLGAVGGIVAGGLAWLGTKLISDLWNLLRGKPVEATKEAVTKIGKFILGGCACCLSPLLLLVFIIFFFIAGVFSVVRQAGQAVTVGTIFDRLEVTKNGAYDPATNSIKYVVVVTNKDSKPQLIQFVRDNTTVYVGDCAQAPVTVDTTTGGPYGYLDFSGMSPGVQEHVDLASGDTITYNYSIKDIPASPGNITYMNKALIEILPRTGVGVSDTGTVIKTVDFGSGGCKGAGDLAAIASALKNCLRIQRNMTTYLILDTSCVSNTPILQTPNCVQAVNTYYIGSTTYNQNLQCVAFANIAVGCYGGADYYVAGNGSDWFDGASAVVYDKYRVGSALSAPPAGSLLTFSSSAGGHIAPVIRSGSSGGRTTVVITGSNMRRTEYTLLFDEHGTLINPEALPGLTFMGFLVPK
ncbi:CHAP domain-containing protein, partial [Patescibacteria group bacterium]|nr:CHAP domain-containing protein [Patescibacteria group bacterium]